MVNTSLSPIMDLKFQISTFHNVEVRKYRRKHAAVYSLCIIPYAMSFTYSTAINVALSHLKSQHQKPSPTLLALQHQQPPRIWPSQKWRQGHRLGRTLQELLLPLPESCPHLAESTTLSLTFSLLSCTPSPFPPTPFPLSIYSPAYFLFPQFLRSASLMQPHIPVSEVITKLCGPEKMVSPHSA